MKYENKYEDVLHDYDQPRSAEPRFGGHYKANEADICAVCDDSWPCGFYRGWSAAEAIITAASAAPLPSHPDDGHTHHFSCVRCGVNQPPDEGRIQPRSAEPRVTALTDALNAVLPDFDIDGDAAAVGSEELAEAVLPVLADNGWHLIEAAAQTSAAPLPAGSVRAMADDLARCQEQLQAAQASAAPPDEGLRKALKQIHEQHTRQAALYDEAEAPCICGRALAADTK